MRDVPADRGHDRKRRERGKIAGDLPAFYHVTGYMPSENKGLKSLLFSEGILRNFFQQQYYCGRAILILNIFV